MTPKVLQQRARDCLRVARKCPDPSTKETLRERAAGFARSAFELEKLRTGTSHSMRSKHAGRRRTAAK
jgi:hypothetical protein